MLAMTTVSYRHLSCHPILTSPSAYRSALRSCKQRCPKALCHQGRRTGGGSWVSVRHEDTPGAMHSLSRRHILPPGAQQEKEVAFNQSPTSTAWGAFPLHWAYTTTGRAIDKRPGFQASSMIWNDDYISCTGGADYFNGPPDICCTPHRILVVSGFNSTAHGMGWPWEAAALPQTKAAGLIPLHYGYSLERTKFISKSAPLMLL